MLACLLGLAIYIEIFLFSHTTLQWYMQGVVVSSIGNRTLYYPQLRRGLAKLTVVLRLLKFVGALIKNDAVLRVYKKASSRGSNSQMTDF